MNSCRSLRIVILYLQVLARAEWVNQPTVYRKMNPTFQKWLPAQTNPWIVKRLNHRRQPLWNTRKSRVASRNINLLWLLSWAIKQSLLIFSKVFWSSKPRKVTIKVSKVVRIPQRFTSTSNRPMRRRVNSRRFWKCRMKTKRRSKKPKTQSTSTLMRKIRVMKKAKILRRLKLLSQVYWSLKRSVSVSAVSSSLHQVPLPRKSKNKFQGLLRNNKLGTKTRKKEIMKKRK